jgi:hypothetical protein
MWPRGIEMNELEHWLNHECDMAEMRNDAADQKLVRYIVRSSTGMLPEFFYDYQEAVDFCNAMRSFGYTGYRIFESR